MLLVNSYALAHEIIHLYSKHFVLFFLKSFYSLKSLTQIVITLKNCLCLAGLQVYLAGAQLQKASFPWNKSVPHYLKYILT